MTTLSHQDWQTVVFRKSLPQQKKDATIKPQTATMSVVANKPAWKIEQQVDSETSKPIKFVSKEDASAIISGRVALKMTQKDLANKLCMQEKDIKDIESCKSVENKATLSKIKKLLNIK